MKKLFKALSIVVLVVMIVAVLLTGCGGSTKTEGTETTKKAVNIKEIKIGLINEITGSMANAGGKSVHTGEMVAIDMINKKGGVMGKYPVVPVVADDKSDPATAKSEVERLIKQEKVSMITGGFPSAFGMAIGEVTEANKTFYWVQTPTTDELLRGKNRQYIFRVQTPGSMWGTTAVDFINANYAKLGVKSASDLKVAIVNENSPFGVYVAKGNTEQIQSYDMNLVLSESYDKKTTKDFKPIVQKLIAAKPDVLFHSAYNQDMIDFMKAAKELNFKVKAIVGHGAGYYYAKEVGKVVGKDMVNYVFDSESPMIQLIPKEKLAPGLYELNQEALALAKEKYNDPDPSVYFSHAFVNTYLLFDKVMPIAIDKYGEITSETLRKAALEVNIPEKGTGLGFGVKFAPPGDEQAGQNTMSFPYVMQWVNDKASVVWPESFKTQEPILPFPSDSFFGK